MEVQRKVVVRTKSGSFTKNKPRRFGHCKFIGESSGPSTLRAAAGPCGGIYQIDCTAAETMAMVPGPPLNSVLESQFWPRLTSARPVPRLGGGSSGPPYRCELRKYSDTNPALSLELHFSASHGAGQVERATRIIGWPRWRRRWHRRTLRRDERGARLFLYQKMTHLAFRRKTRTGISRVGRQRTWRR
jgi:hypothetical protein